MKLTMRDYLLLAGFCLLLFGYSMFSGRPLSMHEARLPQCSREMMSNHDWLVPRSGGRPWLERPPLPHWITVGVSAVCGQHCDHVWAVRLPAALMGCITVLLTAWIANRLLGRWIALTAGFALATMYEFYSYASLAEDDIFLAAIVAGAMACFVASVFPRVGKLPDARVGLFASRPWAILGFFLLLGISNLAKGPGLGPLVVGATVAAFVIWSKPPRTNLRRYVWVWGWIMFAALAVFWPIFIYRHFPDVLENWRIDYAGGTSQYNEPFWYYPLVLLWGGAPWSPAALLGLGLIVGKAFRGGDEGTSKTAGSVERFLCCWAIIPVLALSIPARKHHHYLVPSLAPWAILAAIGLKAIAQHMFSGSAWSRKPIFGLLAFGLPGAVIMGVLHHKIPSPLGVTVGLIVIWLLCVGAFYVGLWKKNGVWTMGAVVAGVAIAFCWGQSYLPDETMQDTAFLTHVNETVPRDQLLTINADLHGELDFFRNAFYLREDAILLHNLTFLRDDKLRAEQVYVVTRYKDLPRLETMGTVQKLEQSAHTRREKTSADRFTLFLLRFDPGLQRYPTPAYISTVEAMGRAKGPWCGPAFAN